MGWQSVDPMLEEISHDETQQDLIFVGEADYQQELSNRGFWRLFCKKESLVISSTMIRENQANIGNILLNPSDVSLQRKCCILREAPVMEDHSSHDLARYYDAPKAWNTHVSTRSKTVRDDELPKDTLFLLGQYDCIF